MHTPSSKNKSNGTEASGAARFPSAGRQTPDSNAGVRARRTEKPFSPEESEHGSSRGGRSYQREGRRDISGRGERRFSHDDGPSFHRDRRYDRPEDGADRGSSRDDKPSFSHDRRPGRPYSREDRENFAGRGERRFSHDDRPSFHRDRSYDRSGDGIDRGFSRDGRPSFNRDRRPGRPYSREDREDFSGRGEHRFSHDDRPSFHRERRYDRAEEGSDRGSFRDERPFSASERHPGRPYMREARADNARREERSFPRDERPASDSGSRPGRPYMREDRTDSTPRGERSFSHNDRPSFNRDAAPRSDFSRGGYRGDSRPASSSGDDGQSGYGQRKPFAKRWTVDEKDEQDFLRENQFDGCDGYDVIILGAGASGLSCALRCTELGLSVCVIDRERTPARKLAICGGGRANFTNSSLTPDCYLCGTVLDAFSTMGMTRFMDSLGLPWEKREGGRYFLDTSARDLVSALIRGCKKGRFALRTGLNVPADGVHVSDGSVTLTAKDGTSVKGRHLVLALGSPACPAVGATGFGYALAQSLGHHVITPEAALTPFILPEDSALFGLQGVSLPVELTVGGETKRTFRDDLLFTHEGLSGPAALKASLFWHREEPVTIDFFAGQDPGPIFSDEQCGRGTPRSILSKRMPQSLVDSLVPEELLDRRCAEIAKAEREGLLQNLRKYTLVPAGTAGLRYAEVCRGGVDTSEVVPMTFFSRVVPGLSIIGELLDVTGLLGGYNLHWAIASGRLAAIALRTRLG